MKKLLLVGMVFFSLNLYAQNEDPWALVEELTIELESSTVVINNLRAEVFSLEEDKTVLTNQLEETTDELEATTEILVRTRDELREAQEEIDYFRNNYQDNTIADINQTFGFGVGATYPLGGEIIGTLEVPFLKIIDIYARVGYNQDTTISAGAGIIVNF